MAPQPSIRGACRAAFERRSQTYPRNRATESSAAIGVTPKEPHPNPNGTVMRTDRAFSAAAGSGQSRPAAVHRVAAGGSHAGPGPHAVTVLRYGQRAPTAVRPRSTRNRRGGRVHAAVGLSPRRTGATVGPSDRTGRPRATAGFRACTNKRSSLAPVSVPMFLTGPHSPEFIRTEGPSG